MSCVFVFSETFTCVTLKGKCELRLCNSDAFVYVLIFLYKRKEMKERSLLFLATNNLVRQQLSGARSFKPS